MERFPQPEVPVRLLGDRAIEARNGYLPEFVADFAVACRTTPWRRGFKGGGDRGGRRLAAAQAHHGDARKTPCRKGDIPELEKGGHFYPR